ncbi:MAG: BMP family ABC transporter substrate-binding protein, partial [Ureaplasma sp.]|nr:BMP family ABC transporter substrate-binding protein [Ureaplasma sp.]
MIASKSKKKLLIYSISIPTSIAVISGVTVGGYFLSSNSNPFLEYAKGPINNTNEAFQAVYYSYLINNAHLMVLPGFTLTSSMTSALKDPKFNDAAFIIVDDKYNGESTSQVAGASFRSDQGSFVTGIAIAMYLNENKEYFSANDGKLTWGTYGGLPFNSVLSFMTGVQLGIAWFNSEIANKNPDFLPIEQISLGNSNRDIFAGGFGTNDGDYLIDRFLQTKIDCLMPVAGPQTLTAINKIVAKKSKTIVIGVDSAIENDRIVMTKKLPQSSFMPDIDLIAPFSSLKNTGLITYNILNNIKGGYSYNNTKENNNIGGLGYQSLGTLENECVGVSENGKKYFINAMNI